MKTLRRLFKAGLLLLAAALLAALAGIWVLQSNWFKNRVRAKIAAVVEDVTGGRVETAAFDYDWRALTASLTGFVLHGTESAGQPPLLRAEKIELGLRVLSLLEPKVDLAFLRVTQPRLHVTVSADGRSNLPVPKRPFPKNLLRELLDMQIRDLSVRDGLLEYNALRWPLQLQALDTRARFFYQGAGPLYRGEIAARSLRLNSPAISNAAFAFSANLEIDKNRLKIAASRFVLGQSSLEATGEVDDLAAPHGFLDLKAKLRPQDLNAPFQVPIAAQGEVDFAGRGTFRLTPKLDWELNGHAQGRGLAYPKVDPRLNNLTVAGTVKLSPERLALTALHASGPAGSFSGRLDVANWNKLSLRGDVRGIAVHQFVANLGGTAAGPVEAESYFQKGGFRDARVSGRLTLTPGGTGIPLQGLVDAAYDQKSNRIDLQDSSLTVGNSQVQMSGTLGQLLTVHVVSRDLQDLAAALPLTGRPAPRDLPLTLKGGTARFDGTVTGPLTEPRLTGRIDISNFTAEGQDFDRLTGGFDLASSAIKVQKLSLSHSAFRLEVSGQAGLTNWTLRDSSPISGSISLHGAEIQRLLAERHWNLPVTGILAATAQVGGTYGSLEASAGLDAESVTAFGEPLSRVRTSVVVSGPTLKVIDGRVSGPAGQLDARGSYEHAPNDWGAGHLRFEVNGRGLDPGQLAYVRRFRTGIGGQADLTATGTARFTNGEFRLETVTSQATLRNASLDGRRFGSMTLTAVNRGVMLDIRGNANLLNTPLQGGGEWKLEGDDPGHGEILIPHVTLATLHELAPAAQRTPLPFEGFLEGRIDIDGPLRKPDQMIARIRLNALQINALAGAKPKAGSKAPDLVLRNASPILLTANLHNLEIGSAQIAGTDTTLAAQGRVSFDQSGQWNLQLRGAVNLAILQLFQPDLLGSGNSVVNATVRGTLRDPQVEGRLELRNAALSLSGLPNGLDQANGVVLFDRNRATVDSLSATTGGGRVTVQKGSFIGFQSANLIYRVQASADQVRYRSPEGVSLTANAVLNLVGTSENSVLSGMVTVTRAGFNPTTDVGGLLAATTRPVSAPAGPSDYLRGIQLDLRVESSQSLQIETSLTRNIEAEVNLRVRGTPDRPVVLGTMSVNQGQIEFFGNRYSINRGQINFVNPVKIEPNIDMDLETSVRGITVDISFSGPLNKLGFSYRSDPPLQTNDIIALLAVGRTPTQATGAVVASQVPNNSSSLSTSGSSSLLSQAISAPAEGRLQRFFGVSHIKIDPQLTDITSVPQARLTLEQQISRDISLTYITNLARTQEQIIRVEWAVNRQWSVIALRDENGAFGIDFQYRKRFK